MDLFFLSKGTRMNTDEHGLYRCINLYAAIAKKISDIIKICGYLCKSVSYSQIDKLLSSSQSQNVPSKSALICPISAPGENFNPRNTTCIYPKGIYYAAPVVKIFAFLDLEQISADFEGTF